MTSTIPYIGRFAPTPSGPLHFGSLVAALGSYLDARAHGGCWLIRIEDVDSTRSQALYIDDILQTLSAHGMHADRPVRIQSRHLPDYREALERLSPHLYVCTCSRKQWHAQAQTGALGPIYPGFCRERTENRQDGALRLRLPDITLAFHDRALGMQSYELAKEIGDPILRRRDGDIAYALAVTVDDALQGITDVVRGADLLAATPIQQYLQKRLDYPSVRYLHLPLALDEAGRKISKQNHAPALDNRKASANLLNALHFLQQNTEGLHASDTPAHILHHAALRWKIPQKQD